MNPDRSRDIRSILLETDLIERAIDRAVAQAIARHKRLGQPIVVWRDGKVVWIPAEAIEVPDEEVTP
jgi:hypothetical protein